MKAVRNAAIIIVMVATCVVAYLGIQHNNLMDAIDEVKATEIQGTSMTVGEVYSLLSETDLEWKAEKFASDVYHVTAAGTYIGQPLDLVFELDMSGENVQVELIGAEVDGKPAMYIDDIIKILNH